MAFEWDGIPRVYRTDRLAVSSEEDKEQWQWANGSIGQNVKGVWLYFQIESNYLERVSPEGWRDNDWIDIRNALIDPVKDVTFYPIHSINSTVSYEIISDASGKQKLLETDRASFKPEVALNVRVPVRLDQYPEWLRMARHKPDPDKTKTKWDQDSGSTRVKTYNQ